jgi:hypothetical protein
VQALAENLAHLAEFPLYFADDLRLQLEREGAEVGRTHDHPGRNAAIVAARGRSLAELRRALDEAHGALATVLERLEDHHLGRVARNRRYGPEPLSTFLERYVLGHKAAHVDQLNRTLARVQP